jgi:hypothetical protein
MTNNTTRAPIHRDQLSAQARRALAAVNATPTRVPGPPPRGWLARLVARVRRWQAGRRLWRREWRA